MLIPASVWMCIISKKPGFVKGWRQSFPADECLDAMRSVGDAMPEAVKETAMGGLASTPTGRRLQKQVFGE